MSPRFFVLSILSVVMRIGGILSCVMGVALGVIGIASTGNPYDGIIPAAIFIGGGIALTAVGESIGVLFAIEDHSHEMNRNLRKLVELEHQRASNEGVRVRAEEQEHTEAIQVRT